MTINKLKREVIGLQNIISRLANDTSNIELANSLNGKIQYIITLANDYLRDMQDENFNPVFSENELKTDAEYITVSGNKEKVEILLAQKMLNRRISVNEYLIEYLSELERKLVAFKEENNIETFEKAKIIYEHIYPKDIDVKKVNDNDNYALMESKRILDKIVTSNMIKSDNGLYAEITHKASLEDVKAPITKIQIEKII